jgi:hypothetical protein
VPTHLQREAELNLRYIRHAMERAASVASISGAGGIGMGLIGLGAGTAALQLSSPTQIETQLGLWLVAAIAAMAVGTGAAMAKGRRLHQPLWNDGARGFLMGLLPSLVIGAALTTILWQRELWDLIPPVWLLCYGAGVLAAGTYAVPPVAWMGAGFIATGVLGLWLPEWQLWLLLASFGALHVIFGLLIMRRYGG